MSMRFEILPFAIDSRCSTTGMPGRRMYCFPHSVSDWCAAVPIDASKSRQVALP